MATTMTFVRVLRIAAIAMGFYVVFGISQAATAARNGGETVPQVAIAIGVLSIFFLVGALATEKTKGPEMDPQKDLLWGLSSGGLAIVASRLVG